jgi:hypothetical protein
MRVILEFDLRVDSSKQEELRTFEQALVGAVNARGVITMSLFGYGYDVVIRDILRTENDLYPTREAKEITIPLDQYRALVDQADDRELKFLKFGEPEPAFPIVKPMPRRHGKGPRSEEDR